MKPVLLAVAIAVDVDVRAPACELRVVGFDHDGGKRE